MTHYPSDSERLSQLTWTRFIAASFVVFFHLGAGVSYISGQPWTPIVTNGPAAVSYFFTLSGFIMAVVYGRIVPEGAISYWVARFARIYPLYLLGLAWFIYYHDWSWLDLFLNLTLLQAWFPGHALSLNGVGWSLSVEAFFYAIFPVLMVVARFIGPAKWAVVVGGFWLISQALVNVVHAEFKPSYPSPAHDLLYYFPLFHLGSFLVGMVAGMWVGRIRMPSWAALLTCLISLAAISYVMLYPWKLSALVGFQVVTANGLLAPLFAVTIISIFNMNAKPMRSSGGVLLGESSYALYILHVAVAEAASRFFVPLAPMTDLKFLGLFAALVGISFAAYVLIETPLRKLIRRAYNPSQLSQSGGTVGPSKKTLALQS